MLKAEREKKMGDSRMKLSKDHLLKPKFPKSNRSKESDVLKPFPKERRCLRN